MECITRGATSTTHPFLSDLRTRKVNELSIHVIMGIISPRPWTGRGGGGEARGWEARGGEGRGRGGEGRGSVCVFSH